MNGWRSQFEDSGMGSVEEDSKVTGAEFIDGEQGDSDFFKKVDFTGLCW